MLRHKRRGECPVPREWRLCRLCRKDAEDEEHVFLHCTGNGTLVSLRETFLSEARELDPISMERRDTHELLLSLLKSEEDSVLQLVARYIFHVLRLVLEVELWRPDASLYENAALPLSDDDSLGSDEENEGVGAGAGIE